MFASVLFVVHHRNGDSILFCGMARTAQISPSSRMHPDLCGCVIWLSCTQHRSGTAQAGYLLAERNDVAAISAKCACPDSA